MIGIDIARIERFRKLAASERFLERAFDETERAYLAKKHNDPSTVAGFWAMKEAAAKALGTGFTAKTPWHAFQIRFRGGAPYIAAPVLMRVSVSHDGDYAIAVAVRTGTYPRTRAKDTHKGDYGKILLMGGSKGMAGSITLATMAALRSGAGLTYTRVPHGIFALTEERLLEGIVLDAGGENFLVKDERFAFDDYNVVAIGPGGGNAPETREAFTDALKRTRTKLVVDASALDAYRDHPTPGAILTPHHGEFARLIDVPIEDILNDRTGSAKRAAKRFGSVVVLKGYPTIVTDGTRTRAIRAGNPGMATAGSGDILTGIIAARFARKGAFEAAVEGVILHGRAGNLAARSVGEESLIARDIIRMLPKAFQK